MARAEIHFCARFLVGASALFSRFQVQQITTQHLFTSTAGLSAHEFFISNQITKGRYPGLPIDEDRFLYRGMRLTVQQLESILRNGLAANASFGSLSLVTKYSGEAAERAIYVNSNNSLKPDNDFVIVVLQINARKYFESGGKHAAFGKWFSLSENLDSRAITSVWIYEKWIGFRKLNRLTTVNPV